MPNIYETNGEKETVELGAQFAQSLRPGDIIGMNGELGAGKTEFVRGVCKALKVKDPVTSPTFSIINRYSGENEEIAHIDLYRIEKPEELNEIGFEELIYDTSIIKFVEWYEKAGDRMPKMNYIVNIDIVDEDIYKRKIIISK
jgi:tRNA threonylcarbamoyladenosine biosynthesis protein TsaE